LATIGTAPALTLEQFFLADYNKLKEENEQLKEKIRKITDNNYGCFDMRKPCETVCIEVADLYRFRDEKYYGFTVDKIKEALELDDESLWDWGLRSHVSTSYYETIPIKVSRHTYYYTLNFVETKKNIVLLTDGEAGSELIPIYDWDFYNPADNLGKSLDICYEDDLKNIAIQILRGRLKKALEEKEDS